ncbi:MAG: NADP-binding protein [Candidatus Bathyarchaeia archaeon]
MQLAEEKHANPKIRVVLYGIGAMGSLIAKEILRRDGVEIVGAVDIAEEKIGRDLGDVIDLGRRLGITVSGDVDSLLSVADADIVVHATSSFLKDVYPQIGKILEHEANVISTCEELSYPYISDPDLAGEIDRKAHQHNVTVLGTGINPGFLMDTLVIVLTAVCRDIRRIEVRRVIDASTRRIPFQKKIGAGLSVEEFKDKIRRKLITGHVGLKQSIAMTADALGWNLQNIEVKTAEPVIAEKHIDTGAISVNPGHVAGLKQTAIGIKDGKPVIVLEFQAYLGSDEEYDSVTILGTPEIRQKISPCIHGDIGTAAIVANLIPTVLNAPPGLMTMKDLPIPSAALEDMRTYVKQPKTES